MNSFYSRDELDKIGFKSMGQNVLISRNSSLYNTDQITIGDNVRIDDFCILSGSISLGNFVHIAAYSALYGSAGIELRDFSGLSSRVTIYSASDDYSGNYLTNPTVPSVYANVLSGRVILEKHVIVGATSVILPGVSIGEGSAIGSMSLVTKSLPGWKICVGSPAKPIKDRARKLLELERSLLDCK